MSEQPIVFYASISQLKNLKVVDVTSYGMKYVHAVENEAQDRNFVTKTNINEQLRQHTNVYSMVFRDMILPFSHKLGTKTFYNNNNNNNFISVT